MARLHSSAFAATTLLLAFCGGAACGAQPLTDVVVGLPTTLSYNFAMFAAALELGYYEEEGLNVKFQEFQGGTIVMSQVASKKVTIGAGVADALIIANQPTKTRFPIKFFYNQTRNYNWEFVVPSDSPIHSISDLRGKKIGIGALANTHMPVTRVILKENGLTENKDYSFVPVGVGATAFRALSLHRIDAYNTFTANTAAFETLEGGNKLRALPIGEKYQTLFQNGFFAHIDTINSNPEVLIGFGRATAKATLLCQHALEYCIESYWRLNKNSKPHTEDKDIAKRTAEAMRGVWSSYVAFPEGNARAFGSYPEEGWQNFISILSDGGAISTKYDPSSLYTNEFVEEINRFDRTDILERAQSLD